jgi:DNA-binding NtrC family response regulator
MASILVVENDSDFREQLTRLLIDHGHRVDEASGVPDAKELIKAGRYDLVLADLKLDPDEGTDLIAVPGEAPVMIMTSYGNIPSAVKAIQMGAVDYITKSADHEALLGAIARVLSRGARITEEFCARSAVMKEVVDNIAKIAPRPATVLILGETGTGKELVARAIHAASQRSGRFVVVNCAAIPESLIESELLGHDKGAFSGATYHRPGPFEEADAGTVFLDEIGELSLHAQARLLRVLDRGETCRVGSNTYRKVDVRVIAATHRNLERMVEAKAFREDLYYRLMVCRIRLPPLRERPEDLEPLADQLLDRARERAKCRRLSFTTEALEAMRKYRWRGNVRELQNVIESAVTRCESSLITRKLLDLKDEDPVCLDSEYASDPVSEEERRCRIIQEMQGQYTDTEIGKRFDVTRKTIWQWRKRYGIERPKRKSRLPQAPKSVTKGNTGNTDLHNLGEPIIDD